MSASSVVLYISYSIPIVCQFVWVRRNIRYGSYWFGKIGLLSNIITLLWTCFSNIIYALPSVMPTDAGNMNYVCAVYDLLCTVMAADWFSRARRVYHGHVDGCHAR
ncbi:hypothetical protein LZ32DRAFT_596513 [Colletotrichum eremochloae]|nr:hypothetical protein LZ32DRAFT_596513 [Colletotrichum eremochloae]